MLTEGLAAWLVVSATALPIGSAENHAGPRPRAGAVVPGPERSDTLRALLNAIRADAASVDAGQAPSVGEPVVEEVTWSDGSIGCPQPGRLYTQALVPGWRIRFESTTPALHYHASHRGQWLLCRSPLRSRPLPGAATR